MESIVALFSALFALSIALNVLLWGKLRIFKKRPPKPTLEAETLLHDLTNRGNAIIQLKVIDPAGLFLRSPKH